MYNDGKDHWFGITNTSDHWPWNKEKDMIKKHPQSRAERMLINEKKKRDKRKSIEGFSNKSSSTVSSDIEDRREDS